MPATAVASSRKPRPHRQACRLLQLQAPRKPRPHRQACRLLQLLPKKHSCVSTTKPACNCKLPAGHGNGSTSACSCKLPGRRGHGCTGKHAIRSSCNFGAVANSLTAPKAEATASDPSALASTAIAPAPAETLPAQTKQEAAVGQSAVDTVVAQLLPIIAGKPEQLTLVLQALGQHLNPVAGPPPTSLGAAWWCKCAYQV